MGQCQQQSPHGGPGVGPMNRSPGRWPQGGARSASETQVIPYTKQPGCPYAMWPFTGRKAASAVPEHIPLAAVIHCQKYVRTF